jgi:hypothetical protein
LPRTSPIRSTLAPVLVTLHPIWVPRIILDFDPPQPEAPEFEHETSDLVYFLSWAYSARFGASHDLSQAALILRGEFKIDLAPLLTFADRNVEEPEDKDILDRSWQNAGPLAQCCEEVTRALESDDERLRGLANDYPGLCPSIEQLGRIASWAAARGSRIRVTYEMEED